MTKIKIKIPTATQLTPMLSNNLLDGAPFQTSMHQQQAIKINTQSLINRRLHLTKYHRISSNKLQILSLLQLQIMALLHLLILSMEPNKC